MRSSAHRFPVFWLLVSSKSQILPESLGFYNSIFNEHERNHQTISKPSVHWLYHVISCYIISPNEKCADSCKSPSFPSFGRQSKWLKDIPTSNCTQAPDWIIFWVNLITTSLRPNPGNHGLDIGKSSPNGRKIQVS